MNGTEVFVPVRHTGLKSSLAPLAIALAIWLPLWLAGFPLPNGDDAFFCGAAIQWAKTGVLANPWITGWMQWIDGVHLDRFHVHPPFFSWVLSAWVKIFGVSTAVMTGFSCAVGFVATVAATQLLRRLGAIWPAAVVGALMIAAHLLHRGLRPEPLGLAVLLCGQVLMLGSTRAQWTAGCLLTMASPGCHAMLFAVATPAMLLHFAALRRDVSAPAWRDRLLLGAGAAGAVVVIFAVAIRGELRAFLHDFLGHAQIATPQTGHRAARFFKQLLLGWERWPNLFVLAAVTLLAAQNVLTHARQRQMILLSFAACGLLAAIGIALYAPFAVAYVVMATAFAALVWSRRASGAQALLLTMPAATLLGWSVLQQSVQFTADRQAANPAAWAAAREYAVSTIPDFVLFDAMTLRYVFDFRPPERSADLSWSWSKGMPNRWWSPAALGERDLWVVSAVSRAGGAKVVPDPTPVTFLGLRINSARPSNRAVVVAGDSLRPPPLPLPLFFRSATFRAAGALP
jgi:hypothetical protein